MALTIEKIRQYYLPKNASRVNNFTAASHQLAVYNDSIPLYSAIKLVIDEEVVGITGTDITHTADASYVGIESSSGTSTAIPGATTTLAGIMTAADKVRLNSLVTLSGVAANSTHLGAFIGGIISDNRTIKQALQDLETSIETGTGLPLGDLTSVTSAITVTGGSNSIFVPTGVSLTLVPGNIQLNTLGGSLSLSQLSSGGASTGQVLN